jgi:2,3-dihydroxybenzoate decarboxylase
MAKKPYIIALEEHYQDPEVKQLGGPGAGREIVERLDDLGALRIREMDEAGIDLQVLSHSIPWAAGGRCRGWAALGAPHQ